jgi:NAD-dependent dihydropyrimidine dehydrogenase PreA subunit
MYIVNIESDKCRGCEGCKSICPEDVFRLAGGKSDPYRTGDCVCCESCLEVCPAGAIRISGR